jgi:radical SAM protein with 4Fe4S-binding SPASM domain
MNTKLPHKLDKVTFEKLRRIAPNLLAAKRLNDEQRLNPRQLPEEVAFKLTNRCDLRCQHCYQWKEGGYHRDLSANDLKTDLDIAIIEKVLKATKSIRSNLYLWGGEPLVYKQWDALVDLLEKDVRWISICTNGTLIERRLEGLLRLSSHLEVSISIDGFEELHNAVRGKGAYQKTLQGLRTLVAKKRSGEFKGEITVNCVITDEMLPLLFEFLQYLQDEGVDTIYISFPWFLSEQACTNMDRYYGQHFSQIASSNKGSWYSYDYQIDIGLVETIKQVLHKIDNHSWGLKIRYNPELSAADIASFISGSDTPIQNKQRCQSIYTRMDVFPSGEVVSCKFFPEFKMGSLKNKDVSEVWHGETYSDMRETISKCGLMPVCAKCNLLYTRGG